MDKCIILEIIPTASKPHNGEVAQLSALMVENYKLVDKFDARIVDQKIKIQDLKDLISYDKDSFSYKADTATLMKDFDTWSKDYPLLLLDNSYTQAYLEHYNINNEKKPILPLLNMKYHDLVIDDIMQKYNLQQTNHIVDLLYEALIYESNNKSMR